MPRLQPHLLELLDQNSLLAVELAVINRHWNTVKSQCLDISK